MDTTQREIRRGTDLYPFVVALIRSNGGELFIGDEDLGMAAIFDGAIVFERREEGAVYRLAEDSGQPEPDLEERVIELEILAKQRCSYCRKANGATGDDGFLITVGDDGLCADCIRVAWMNS